MPPMTLTEAQVVIIYIFSRVANPIQSRELIDYRLSNFVSIGLSIGLPKVLIDWIIIDGFLSIIDN